ncbi:MAG: DNA repair protein RadA [Oscillospiraceae bacterium]|nr:DNA repair protein RadA [Oscillospiraceae bacterium]
MAKSKIVYFCTQCGNETPKWQGRCPSCGQWNTLQEHIEKPNTLTKRVGVGQSRVPVRLNEVDTNEEIRFSTGIGELNRVLGGGAVAGSLVLVGGAPGIGKSTLLLQICKSLCDERKVLYVSGEESEKQLKMRALRIGVASDDLYILSETRLSEILETVDNLNPDILIVDSIQTLYNEASESTPGSVSQVKDCTISLMQLSKAQGITVFVVGHINKDGAIAGPKVLEHMVDCVLYFEGDSNSPYRLLRAAKNRFGSTNEIGVFEMIDTGLVEVPNPSQMLLQGRPHGASGTCVACVMEGTRPVLAEVQALVAKTSFNVPRRTADGFDFNRAALLLAVAEKRAMLKLSAFDAYINVIGGLYLDEPGADLPVALAVASSYRDKPIPDDLVAIGEIGLTGEIRSVSHMNQRLTEVYRQGFTKCIIPKFGSDKLEIPQGLTVFRVKNLLEAVEFVL